MLGLCPGSRFPKVAGAAVGSRFAKRGGSRGGQVERSTGLRDLRGSSHHFGWGLKYKLIISLPHSYHHAEAANQRYPVVYALDGEPYLFPLLATVARTEHFFKRTTWFPDLIIAARCWTKMTKQASIVFDALFDC
jgi:hypothetical protein